MLVIIMQCRDAACYVPAPLHYLDCPDRLEIIQSLQCGLRLLDTIPADGLNSPH